MSRFKHLIKNTTEIIEIIISIILIIGVVLGLLDFHEYFVEILKADATMTYDIFQAFLGYALLLIVGVELILMILYHSTTAILELILFVIARKMLIYASTMTDLLLGTAAIALIFVVMRYLINNRVDSFVSRQGNQYSSPMLVKDVIADSGIILPVD